MPIGLKFRVNTEFPQIRIDITQRTPGSNVSPVAHTASTQLTGCKVPRFRLSQISPVHSG